MNKYQYTLQPYTGRNSRYTCPACKKPYQFSKYVSTETGEVLDDEVGKCNRVDKCGYHFTPKQYFQQNLSLPSHGDSGVILPNWGDVRLRRTEGSNSLPEILSKAIEPSYISHSIFKASLKEYNNNNLLKFLYSILSTEQVDQAINTYNIGTSSRYNGGTTIFWQIDCNNKVRTGKLIKYDNNGHRIKNHNNWVHSVLNINNFNLKQCLFGEHLLSQFPGKTIGIVESEKTAIIASVFLPDLLWLATGGVENLNKEKVIPLRGRNVILFPDASKDGSIYLKWKEKGNKFGFQTSDYLEQYTNEEQKAKGVDVADFLKNENKPLKALQPQSPCPPKQMRRREPQSTPQIPYNTPSPVAIIDSKIENPPKFKGPELIIKKRIFTSPNGDKIELVGIRDFGDCGNWKAHDKQNRPCRPCMLNCLHTIKINGKLQEREYSQLEILLTQ